VRLLIDTHALIWAMDDPSKLSGTATTALQDPANDLLILEPMGAGA
jgi:PIN domain nuclease of toxin-antitoxin system